LNALLSEVFIHIIRESQTDLAQHSKREETSAATSKSVGDRCGSKFYAVW
jgi:hypothetical protein